MGGLVRTQHVCIIRIYIHTYIHTYIRIIHTYDTYIHTNKPPPPLQRPLGHPRGLLQGPVSKCAFIIIDIAYHHYYTYAIHAILILVIIVNISTSTASLLLLLLLLLIIILKLLLLLLPQLHTPCTPSSGVLQGPQFRCHPSSWLVFSGAG